MISNMAEENDEKLFILSLIGKFCPISLTRLLKKLQNELDEAHHDRQDKEKKKTMPKRNALKIKVEIERECLEEVIRIQQTLEKIVFDECIEVEEGYLNCAVFSHIYIEIGGMF